MNEEKIIGKLLEHDVHFKKVGDKLLEHDAHFENIDIRLDKMTNMLLNHEDRLQRIEENMATKQDIRGINDTLDVLVKLAKKRDEEETFMSYRIQEHEKEITKVKKDIVQLQTASGLI